MAESIMHDVEFLGGTPVRVQATNCGVVTVNVRLVIEDRQPDSLRRFAEQIVQEQLALRHGGPVI